jgi:hypothetical protein
MFVLRERILNSKLVRLRRIGRFTCSKIDKAQRHQYWTFEVGRSMFDVQSFYCSNFVKFHKVSEDRGS